MKRYLMMSAMMLAMGVSVAHAEGKKPTLNDQGGAYGMAGCGLGSLAFGDEPGLIQIVAATLNETGMQTFAITTGTSNCGQMTKSARATQFIEVNKVALDNDLARGTGEAVASLSQVMGCHNTTFATSLRKSYVVGSSNEQLADAATQACQL